LLPLKHCFFYGFLMRLNCPNLLLFLIFIPGGNIIPLPVFIFVL
jgi:hypothetical protein